MFDVIYKSALRAQDHHELKDILGDLPIDPINRHKPFYTPAGQLAAGKHFKAVKSLRELGAKVDYIAMGYAFANCHQHVEKYRIHHRADVDCIAVGYALAGNHPKVEEYRSMYSASVDLIAQAYAFAGYHAQVELYRKQYKAYPDLIAQGYAHAGNEAKTEKYRLKHKVHVDSIAVGYTRYTGDIPRLYRAIILLQRHGATGEILIDIINRLKNGQDSRWNPYWINCSRKLEQILLSVEALTQSDNLEDQIDDPNSLLYRALNLQRISPVTFFGRLGCNQAKSLIAVQEELVLERADAEPPEAERSSYDVPLS